MKKYAFVSFAIAIILTTIMMLSYDEAKATEEIYKNEQGLTLEEVVKIANEELKRDYEDIPLDYFLPKNLKGKQLTNNKYVMERALIVYGAPHGDEREKRFRHIGYTFSDESFTNVYFPHDAKKDEPLWNRSWVKDPANNKLTKNRVKGTDLFNNNPLYKRNIEEGLKLAYGSIEFPNDKLKSSKWYEYVHVHQPPTMYSWGSGRMWHSKGDWYLTVPIAPHFLLSPNLTARDITYTPDKVKSNEEATTCVWVTNDSIKDITTLLAFRVNGETEERRTITIPSKKPIQVCNFKFTPPTSGEISIEFEVNPIKDAPKGESDWTDNKVSKVVQRDQDDVPEKDGSQPPQKDATPNLKLIKESITSTKSFFYDDTITVSFDVLNEELLGFKETITTTIQFDAVGSGGDFGHNFSRNQGVTIKPGEKKRVTFTWKNPDRKRNKYICTSYSDGVCTGGYWSYKYPPNTYKINVNVNKSKTKPSNELTYADNDHNFTIRGNTSINLRVNRIYPVVDMNVDKYRPDGYFLVGKKARSPFPVRVYVHKNLGSGSTTAKVKLTRQGYGLSWSDTKTVSVGTTQSYTTFNVPNITETQLKNWQKNNGGSTAFSSFHFTAEIIYSGAESTKEDNKKSSTLSTGIPLRSQISN